VHWPRAGFIQSSKASNGRGLVCIHCSNTQLQLQL
jgi:hypothetical protein